MAEYYVDVSATYDGDGTAATAAASAGAVGASNSLINAITGTSPYMTLAAGDIVHVRTHDGSTNLSESFSASITSSGGTYDAPITFKFDDGTKWAQGGEFTLDYTSPNDVVVTLSYHYYLAEKLSDTSYRFNIKCSANTASAGVAELSLVTRWCRFVGMRAYSDYGNSQCPHIRIMAVTDHCRASFYDCRFEKYFDYTYQCDFIGMGRYNAVYFYNCIFDFGASSIDNTFLCFVYPSSISSMTAMRFVKCRWLNVQPNHNLFRFPSTVVAYQACFNVDMYDCDVSNFSDAQLMGYIAQVGATSLGTSVGSGSRDVLKCTAMNGKTDFVAADFKGWSRWSETGNFPVRDASLPRTDNMLWSMQILSAAANRIDPYIAPATVKVNSLATSATRSIMAKVLFNEAYGPLTDYDVWLDVTYTDATGAPGFLTTRCLASTDATALAADAAPSGWSGYNSGTGQVGYGAQNYDCYQISASLPGGLKQNTPVTVHLNIGVRAANVTTDFTFFDPDFELS